MRTVMRLRRQNASVGFDLLGTAGVADLKRDVNKKACFQEIEVRLGGLMVTTYIVILVKGPLPTKTLSSLQSIAGENLTKKTNAMGC